MKKGIDSESNQEMIHLLDTHGYNGNVTKFVSEVLVPFALAKKCSLMRALQLYSKQKSGAFNDHGPYKAKQALHMINKSSERHFKAGKTLLRKR